MSRSLYCILVYLIIPFTGSAQNGWTIYNSTNSPLPENSVRCITIDQNGLKWIGTEFGLASFDDINWTVYQTTNSGLPDNSIRSLAVDQQNNLWIGTFSGGLVKFDGSTWTVYNTGNSDLPDDFVRCLVVDTLNNKWIGTIGGLAYFDDVNWVLYNTSNSILGSNNIGSIYVDKEDNSVAIGTINGGLTLIDDTAWTPYTLWNSNLPDNTILGLDEDSSGVLWLATPAAGLSAHIGGFSFLTFNTASSTIASNSLTSISIAADETIWVSSNDSGIIKRDGSTFEVYNTLNSPLPDNFVHTINADEPGIIWIGTLQGGLIRFDESLYLPVKEITATFPVQLFPVPAKEILFIKANDQTINQVYIYDTYGKIIRTKIVNSNNTSLDTSDLPSGTYIAKIIGANGMVASKIFSTLH